MEMRYKQAFARLELLTVADLADGKGARPLTAALVHQDAAGRLLLGASLAHATGAADPDGAAALRGITSRAVELIPALADLTVAETRTCVRPVSADGLPYIGPLEGVDGLVVVAGHGGTGVTLGPGSGELVGRGISDGAWDARLLPARAPS
jgi:glycine/D-amino acid oxidase-like deaminating enzyme